MGEVIQFPLKGTRIHEWYSSALAIRNEVNIASAQLWVKEHVPVVFQAMINRNVRLAR